MNTRKQQRLSVVLAILLLLLGFSSHAQERATIRLKNSAFLKNVRIQEFDSSGILLELNHDKGFRKINYSSIKTIKFLPPEYEWTRQTMVSDEPNEDQWLDMLYHQISMGMLFGDEIQSFSFSVINGFKVSPHLYAGMGMGYDRYDDRALLPVFAEVRGYIKEGKFIPYYFGHVGYGFVVENYSEFENYPDYHDEGGLLWKAGMGYHVNFPSSALVFSVAYLNQKYYQEYSFGGSLEVEEKHSFHRVEVKVGVMF